MNESQSGGFYRQCESGTADCGRNARSAHHSIAVANIDFRCIPHSAGFR